MAKFLLVEIIICFLDHTWTTDYVQIPYPNDGCSGEDLKSMAIQQWEKEEEEKEKQRPSTGASISYVGIYNVNWDEPVDENGDRLNESKCFHCHKDVSFERMNSSLPEEYEVCMSCDDHVCNDCVDWKFMKEHDMETPVCKECTSTKDVSEILPE